MDKNLCIIMSKYRGMNKEYLVLDPNKNKSQLVGKKTELLCKRGLGIGANEILFGPILKDGKMEVHMLDSQEGEGVISQDGLRVFAKYLQDQKYVKEEKAMISTENGDVEVEVPGDVEHIEDISLAENFLS